MVEFGGWDMPVQYPAGTVNEHVRTRTHAGLFDVSHMGEVDVRGPDEFTGPLAHLPNALNLPVGTLPGRLKEIEVSDEQPIVLVCRTDKRSAKAAIILHEAGFRDVRVLRGGMERWNGSGQ